MSRRHYSVNTAIAIVVANMIGTGVFTSLGFQLMDIQSTFVLLLCGNSGHAEDGVRYRPFLLRSHWYCLDQLQFRRA